MEFRSDAAAPQSAIPSHLSTTQPTELDLSPSKARAHATTTQAWTQVTNWLREVLDLPPSLSLPQFERNAATLAYLQSLMYANTTANGAREALRDEQVEQLRRYEEYEAATAGDPGRALLKEVSEALTPEGSEVLGNLAEASVLLGSMPPVLGAVNVGENTEMELRRRILDLSVETFELERVLESLNDMRSKFERGTSGIQDQMAASDSDQDREAKVTSLRQQTAQYAAQTKHLALKLAEYRERTNVLSAEPRSGISIKHVRQREKEVNALRQTVEKLEEEVKQYHGLPPDIEASRAEVRRAQTELEGLKRKREELFEQLAAG